MDAVWGRLDSLLEEGGAGGTGSCFGSRGKGKLEVLDGPGEGRKEVHVGEKKGYVMELPSRRSG